MALRTFLAVEVSAAVRVAVAQHAQRVTRALPTLSDVLSWVPPANLHVTVKFFGETSARQVAGIRQAVERTVSTRPAFGLEFEGGGAFPHREAPRVLWVGVGGDLDALTALVEGVEEAVAPLGFPHEEKPFHPHLTVARVTRASRDVWRTLGASACVTTPGACGRVSVERVALFSSARRRGGSVYAKLWDVALKA